MADTYEVEQDESGFHTELKSLLNKHSKENGSDTADFILASYLNTCLETWNYHIKYRESVRTLPPTGKSHQEN